MVKHTQAIRRLLPTNCLNVSDHFVGLVLGLVLKNLIRQFPFRELTNRVIRRKVRNFPFEQLIFVTLLGGKYGL